MKKLLVTFLALAILFASGCNNRQENLPTAGGTEKASAVSESPASRLPSANPENPDAADWPTKAWSISTPAEQGIDAVKLSKADKRIHDNYPNVYSLLVIRHGYLVYEKYYNGMTKDDANPVYSVTKSVMSALTGIALREKLIQSVDQKISELLPEYFTKTSDRQKKNITVYNALTMTGGLYSVDNDFPPYYMSKDWMEYAINQPLTDKPGSKFEYNTGLPHFLSGIITKTSGMNTKTFADKYLFSKIGIHPAEWVQDSKGYYGGGMGLSLTPEDMAKFGYLYLNGGKWNGEQVIPKEWVDKTIQKHVTANQYSDYGYLFWLQTMRSPDSGKSHFTYRADGAGGQKIIMIPDLDMVAVITANVRSSSNDKKDTQDIVQDYVIPAVNQ